ncbi:acyl-CoA dehydrogenase family protein [Halogeometricum sp. S1BR25-6]|uniref:Acyl-CoA dehydrogenase family protein n=1 Tax=Halogeometricum salsisoli TaxID=2950536 RepID=A0ABU2GH87_9EURY|nr:acyl-CoA dehydrogenase family protein [Halogeometricum sp. S1BR25-6]MDS0300191.1 acyl-CoA dehydrogenase family protein [Halogeometricum sp. S1BR25-6]
MITFDDSDAAEELADRARDLMEGVVIPAERELGGGESVSAETVRELRRAARDAGIYAPQISEKYGGMGYDFRDVLPTFEQAGRSLLGPMAMRMAAPDQGNMHLLEMQGTESQKEEYLRPLVAGEISSGFSMTEPMQGAGSDPKMIRTTAEKDGDEWVIDGHKWWTTQGSAADVLLVFARTDMDAHPYAGCSVFIVPKEMDGVNVVRDIPHVESDIEGKGHAEIKYDGVRVPEENLLGEEGKGFQHVQERLGPARLTHCLRFSGMAQRSLSVAKAYLSEREAFGETLSEKQHARFDIAEQEMRLQAARSLNRTAARRIAAGEEARIEVAMCKVFTANVVQETIDTALQYCGANGIGRDLPLADFYESVRQFRIVDGADEVHKRSIARAAFEDVDESELENVVRYGV